MDVTTYLGRIAYRGARTANADTLRALQLAHLQTIPFENLDIHYGDAHAMTDWLADVGWGDTFCVPLRLDRRDLQVEGARAYRLEHTGINYILWQRQYSGE